MFGISFLTTLNIYKNIFRGCYRLTVDATQCKSFLQAYCEPETYALSHISFQEATVFVHCRVL